MAIFDGINFDTIKKTAEEGIQAAQKGIQNFDVEQAVHSIADTASAGVDSVAKAIEQVTGKPSNEESRGSEEDFVRLLCCLAAADGQVTDAEKSKICEQAGEIDQELAEKASDVICECVKQIESSSTELGYQDAAKTEAQRIIEPLDLSDQEQKMLCWNLFAVGGVEGLSDENTDFIRFTCEKIGVNRAVVEELCNYNTTLVELGDAKQQLRLSNRSYSEIEPLVNELMVREQVILEAAQALITDK